MHMFHHQKYSPFAFAPQMEQRQWPERVLDHAPIWASVDLRDGNQALIDPMTLEQKLKFYDILLQCGFKEIEIGFPAASQIEYDFTRHLIEKNLIPDDVTVQVLVQAREHLIERTFESLAGIKRANVHVYNSTSKVQREKVFKKSVDEIIDIAVNGAKMLKEHAARHPQTEWVFQYSPESFSQTEPDIAVQVVNAVLDVWQPQKGQKVIINLPDTVEACLPNQFADQIEYFCAHVHHRDKIIVSVHTHNDRGTGIASAELAVLAGADRVEGTLLGNGERTGNMDILVMAMNLYSQGIDPKLDFSRMNEIVSVVSECNNIPVHPRHPYVGELVFTAFSGSHQDAIKKCLDLNDGDTHWDIAYLPIDPRDIGRSYQDVVRINSQSGKGGVAYILSRDYGLNIPRWLQIDFAKVVQESAEKEQKELNSEEIYSLFKQHYLLDPKIRLTDYHIKRKTGADTLEVELNDNGEKIIVQGNKSGMLNSFVSGLQEHYGVHMDVINYSEHTMSGSTDAQAVAYIQLMVNEKTFTGVAYSQDTLTAVLRATVAALSRARDAQHTA